MPELTISKKSIFDFLELAQTISSDGGIVITRVGLWDKPNNTLHSPSNFSCISQIEDSWNLEEYGKVSFLACAKIIPYWGGCEYVDVKVNVSIDYSIETIEETEKYDFCIQDIYTATGEINPKTIRDYDVQDEAQAFIEICELLTANWPKSLESTHVELVIFAEK